VIIIKGLESHLRDLKAIPFLKQKAIPFLIDRTHLRDLKAIPFLIDRTVPFELRRVFLKKLILTNDAYRGELFRVLSKKRINENYDLYGLKMQYDTNNLKQILTETFTVILYPYLFGPFKYNPDVNDLESYYVDGKHMTIGENDIVFDLGAYNGTFSLVAAKQAANGSVYSFEPFEKNSTLLNKNLLLNKIDNVKVINKAVWERTTSIKMHFNPSSPSASSYQKADQMYRDQTREYEVDTTSIDEFVTEHGIERVDFIKMDIEGAERYALKGAIHTIRRHKPKLSICTYHLADDADVLPKIIHSIRPDYVIEMKRKKLFAY
jgi:FkbM family methyltransferase